MRISVLDIESPPEQYKFMERSRILFNGQLRPFVITADEDAGYIIAYKLGDDGLVVIDEDGMLVTETLRGHVKIIDPESITIDDVYSR